MVDCVLNIPDSLQSILQRIARKHQSHYPSRVTDRPTDRPVYKQRYQRKSRRQVVKVAGILLAWLSLPNTSSLNCAAAASQGKAYRSTIDDYRRIYSKLTFIIPPPALFQWPNCQLLS